MASTASRAALKLARGCLRGDISIVPCSILANASSSSSFFQRSAAAKSCLAHRSVRSIHLTTSRRSSNNDNKTTNPTQTPDSTSPAPIIAKPTEETTTATTAPSSIPAQPEAPHKPRRSLRPWIYASAFFLAGLLSGQFVRAVVFPPPLPAPDSAEDAFYLSKLQADVSGLPLVQELRARRDEWTELSDPYASIYHEEDDAAKKKHMTAGTLRGSRGLGVQRVFYNQREKRSISVVFFGGALSGWPGVTHGGIVATVLRENLERVANGAELGLGRGRLQGEADWRLVDLGLSYKKPTGANALYVVRAEVDDGEGEEGQSGKKKVRRVKATLESALQGHVCASATGICVPNKGGSVLEGAKGEASGLWSAVRGSVGYLFG